MAYDDCILATARLFTQEAVRLDGKKPGACLDIRLRVKKSGRSARMELIADFWDGSTFQSIKASSLGKLMDEVYRRLDFEDRDHTAREANDAALAAIEYQPTIDQEV